MINKINKNHSTGKDAMNWRGGRFLDKDGYVMIRNTEHPHNERGYVREHRLVMEEYIGRVLTSKECVHHINSNKQDNRIENLMLFSSFSEHAKLEHKLGKYKDSPRVNGRFVNKGTYVIKNKKQ